MHTDGGCDEEMRYELENREANKLCPPERGSEGAPSVRGCSILQSCHPITKFTTRHKMTNMVVQHGLFSFILLVRDCTSVFLPE
jgi:hypothetical protein